MCARVQSRFSRARREPTFHHHSLLACDSPCENNMKYDLCRRRISQMSQTRFSLQFAPVMQSSFAEHPNVKFSRSFRAIAVGAARGLVRLNKISNTKLPNLTKCILPFKIYLKPLLVLKSSHGQVFLPLQCPESGLVEHAKPEDTRNKTSKHLGCFRDDLAWFWYPKDKRGTKFLPNWSASPDGVSSSCLRRCCRCLFSVLAFLQSQARPQPKQKMIRKCVGLCLWLCLAFSVWTLPFCRFGDGTSTKWLKWNSLIPLEWEAVDVTRQRKLIKHGDSILFEFKDWDVIHEIICVLFVYVVWSWSILCLCDSFFLN